MKNFFIESGINHFGLESEANSILNFFLKSKFKNLLFMLKSEKFYEDQKKKGINFKLKKSFYNKALKLCHKKNKNFGISVGLSKNLNYLSEIKFDFYKLLGAGINNYELIDILIKKNKPIFISTGFNATDLKINKCLSYFNKRNKKKKVSLLHTPMTYNPKELNFSKIIRLKEKFKVPVGYSNHFNDINSLYIISAYDPASIFIYCKVNKKKK